MCPTEHYLPCNSEVHRCGARLCPESWGRGCASVRASLWDGLLVPAELTAAAGQGGNISQDTETAYVSTDRPMDKEDMSYIHNGILLRYKKGNLVFCNNKDETQGHYAR